MKILKRSELPEDYDEMMKTETHHNHRIVLVNGIIRWKENEGVKELISICDLNRIFEDMSGNGITKNSEEYRRLYRNMGYSLSGYWEIFYWEANNNEVDEYKPPAKAA